MNNYQKGIIFTILGGIFWGLSGVAGQFLFLKKDLNAEWLVTFRLIVAGVLILFFLYSKAKYRKSWNKIWRNKKDIVTLLTFSIFGMSACQLTYYTTVELSNAGTATVLQYTSPILIMLYIAVRNKQVPTLAETTALILAILGTFFLTTHGNLKTLAITPETLVWGIGASITAALYNLIPIKLMHKYGTIPIIGWSMFIGGLALSFWTKPWIIPGIWDLQTYLALAMVIFIGTIWSFSFYLEGVRLIGAAKASLFASSEPLTATIATAIFIQVIFKTMDILGLICILLAVTFLTLQKYKEH